MSDFNENNQWGPPQGEDPFAQQSAADGASASYYESPKKKKKHTWIFVLLGVLVLIGGAACLVMFIPSLRNRFELITLSPEKYYQKVEKRNLDEMFDEAEELEVDIKDQTVHVTGSVKAGSLMEQLVSQAYTVYTEGEMAAENSPGMKLEELSASVDATKNGDAYAFQVGVDYGQSHLVDVKLLKDEEDNFYLQIPELSEATLKFNLLQVLESYAMNMGAGELSDAALQEQLSQVETQFSQVMEQLANAKIDTELLKKITRHYSELVVEEFSEVSREKNVTLTCDGMSQSVTTITISLTSQDLLQILKDVIFEMQKDDDMYQFIYGIYPVTQAQYDSVLGLLAMGLSQTDISDTNMKVNLIVYVDMNGEIIGRGLQIPSSNGDVVFKRYSLTDENRTGEYAYFEAPGGMLECHGILTGDNGKQSGNISVDGLAEGKQIHAADISFTDVSSEGDKNASGNIMVSIYMDSFTEEPMPEEFGNLSPVLKYAISFETTESKSDVTYSFGIGEEANFISCHVGAEITNAEAISYPTENIYSIDQMEEYLAGMNTEEFLKDILDAFGIDAEVFNQEPVVIEESDTQMPEAESNEDANSLFQEETDQAIPNEESEVQIPEDEDLAALLQQNNEESDDFSLEEIGGAAGTVE